MTAQTHNLHRVLPSVIVLLLLVLVSAILAPSFRSVLNLSNVLVQASPLALVAVGQSFPILVEGIDLSVGSVVSLATCIMATLSTHNLVGAVLATLLAGAVVGTLNGLGVVYGRINPLIMTLASMTAIAGAALGILNQPGGAVPLGYENFMFGQIGLLSAPMGVMLLVTATMAWLSLYTRYGRRMYAVGHHEERARMHGVPVGSVKLWAYVISGTLAALGGVVLTGTIGSGDPNAGTSFTLTSIAAVVIGGTLLAGARGSILGSLSGALIIAVIGNMLNQLGVNPTLQFVAQGVLIIAALLAYWIQSQRRRSTRPGRVLT